VFFLVDYPQSHTHDPEHFAHLLLAQLRAHFHQRAAKGNTLVETKRHALLMEKMRFVRSRIWAKWRYADLPRALGCGDWVTAGVKTLGELDTAMKAARH
jgi:hypothetical protein